MPNVLEYAATLKELSDYYAKKQPHQVNCMVEESPILDSLKFEQASHGLWNMYEDVTGVTGAGFVDMNAPLPMVDAALGLKKIDLKIMGGEIECPEDTAKLFGGREKYFSKKMPSILKESGKVTERALLYDNMRAYALERKHKDGKNTVLDCGATTDTCYSIIALREVSGETIGLYSPDGFKSGAMLDTQPINGGNLYKSTTKQHKDVLVYGIRLKGYFGYQIANPLTVGAIVNISKTNPPTAAMLDDIIAEVRGTTANTRLFMHEKVRNMLNAIKGTALRVSVGDKDMDRRVTHWNGVPVVTSYNFDDGTEKREVL